MASAVQNIDELISCLVDMGFEFEDCQDAVKAGKLTPDAAVEWILAGKPVESSQSTGMLRLTQTEVEHIGANPFSNPQPVAPIPEGSSASSAGGASSEDKVVSRLYMNDEQREARSRFEEKQRLEAQRLARTSKMQQKKDRQMILKQIQEDRETQRARHQAPAAVTPSTVSQAKECSDCGPSADTPQSVSKPESTTPTKCVIQVRLPNGRVIRHNFSPFSLLSDVWSYVQDQHPRLENMCLIQPFPRVEFGSEHMNQTLTQLNLVPSGSLVLKKNDSTPPDKIVPAQIPDPSSGSETMETNTPHPAHAVPHHASPMEENQPPGLGGPLGEAGLGPVEQGHDWGSGNVLGQVPEQANPQPQDDAAQQPHFDIAPEDEDEIPFGQHQAAGGHGGGHHVNFWQMQDHFWGDGHRLSNENQPGQAHQAIPAQQLAAEAARRRYTEPRLPEGQALPADQQVSLHHNLLSLTATVIQHVSARICDSKNPISSLSGVPADVAVKVLDHLIKEKLLRPKTLHPFIACHLHRLILDCYPYVTNELLHAIRLHTFISHLSLRSCPLITDKGLQPLTALKRLKFLNFGSCKQLTNNCLNVITEFQQLTTLILEDTGVTDAGLEQYAQSKPQHLNHLNLNRTSVTHNLLPALAAIPNLRSLSLEQTKVSSLSGIQNLPLLESLNVASTSIVSESLICLASLPRLTALNISNTENLHGDTALQYISGLKLQLLQMPSRHTTTDAGMRYLTGMPLQSLDLTNYINVGDMGVQEIGRIHSLKRLLLSNTKITDTGMFCLQDLHNLEVLYVDRTNVGDVGASSITAFQHLQELSLSETGISSKFLCRGSLAGCTVLSKLNLSRTRVSNRGMHCLHLPHLSLLNLDKTRCTPDIMDNLKVQCPNLQRVLLNNLQPRSLEDQSDDDMSE